MYWPPVDTRKAWCCTAAWPTRPVVALGLLDLGKVARYQEDYERAAALYEEGLELYRAQGNAPGSASALNSLGVLARNRGDPVRARALCQEAMNIYQGLGDSRNVSHACCPRASTDPRQPSGRLARQAVAERVLLEPVYQKECFGRAVEDSLSSEF